MGAFHAASSVPTPSQSQPSWRVRSCIALLCTRKTLAAPKRATSSICCKFRRRVASASGACEAWDVFSDVADTIDGSYSMIPVEDAFGEFHQIKRKTGVWVNWGMFYQVWVKVREVGKWQQGDYV